MFMFQDINDNVVSYEQIVSYIDKKYNYEVYLGTDSQIQNKNKKVLYVTCIVLYKKNKGGKIFISKNKERLANSLKERLSNEVFKSLEVAFELSKFLPKNVEIIVHVDVNKNKNCKSSNYYQELVGMVTGQGYKCYIKPQAWAAQSVADKFSK